jgi:hypothetical protein
MRMALPDHGTQWYARRNGTVRGPFTDERIARYVLLGRIRMNDELSSDLVSWRRTRDCPELFPEELLKLSSWEDYQKLVVARMKVDERMCQRRKTRDNKPRPACEERRVSGDRRQKGSEAIFLQYHLMNEMRHHPHGTNSRQAHPLRTFLLATLLVTLVFAYFSIPTW